ncbi:MAG: ABC transporter ATP-binding protein [Firmicutes bacterium]|nr:ABC transporter ATP-binding protein [Bacillota bacterium]
MQRCLASVERGFLTLKESIGDPVVEMRDITVKFPGVIANDNVSVDVYSGEILALLGENGAGKTTLMNVLYGLYRPDAGRIRIHGEQVQINTPNDAIRLGIGMVHQHFMLIPPFTVAENIVLGVEPVNAAGKLDMDKAIRDVEELSNQYGLVVDPRANIDDISVGMQQRVEILKALYRGAEVLILDEPTAVLTPQEVDELAAIMRSLVHQGKSIIFITHKLREVIAISDRVAVLRRGKCVGTGETKNTTAEELAQMMVGREVVLSLEKEPAKPGDTVLRVENLHARSGRNLPALRGVFFDVKAGEIVGIAGIEGNGQSELVETLTGLRKSTSGHIYVNGIDVAHNQPRALIEQGVAHIPEDRQNRGLILDFTVAENFILRNYYKSPFARGINLDYRKVQAHARDLISEFDVRTPHENIPVRSLSGGNQQKVVVARELSSEPKLLIASQPTRGLDVGAIEFVHKRLLAQRDQGKAILLVSLELDEIMSLSDRILVIYEGQIVGEMAASEATEGELGLLMAGGHGKRGLDTERSERSGQYGQQIQEPLRTHVKPIS